MELQYFKEFNTHEEYIDYIYGNPVLPNVSFCGEKETHYNKYHDYSKDYLTFKIIEDGIVKNYTYNVCEYSLNNNKWNILSEELSVKKGDSIQFRVCDENSVGNIRFTNTTCKFKVVGNVMSLCYKSDYETNTTLPKARVFNYLFQNCTGLTDASDLNLPATSLTPYCYDKMFIDCSSLVFPPKLPATELGTYCYNYMFKGCISLIKAPELPATTLNNYCYYSMFDGCTSLLKAPDLNAETLVTYCYGYMFSNCRNLSEIKCLAINGINQNNSTLSWLGMNSVAVGTFIKNKEANNWDNGSSGIPNNWNIVDFE